MKAVETITTRQAASMIHKNPSFIRKGLQQKRFDFGSAVKTSDGKWNYNIIKSKFLEYIGQEEQTNT